MVPLNSSGEVTSRGVAVKDGEIGELPGYDRALFVVLTEQVRRAKRHGMERLQNGNALVLAEDAARHGLARGRRPHRKKRIDRRHGRIRVQAEGDSQALRASCRIHVSGPVWSGKGRIVQIAPVIDVVGEEVRGDAQLLHSQELLLRHELIVLQPVSSHEPRILTLCCSDRHQGHIRGLAGVGVDH